MAGFPASQRMGGEEDDAQDHRSPAAYLARKHQAGPLFTGAPDLAAGHVADYDRRDGRQRPESELPQTAGEAGYRESVNPGRRVTMVVAAGPGTVACARCVPGQAEGPDTGARLAVAQG